MKKQELIEKLEDLATFFTLAALDAEEKQKKRPLYQDPKRAYYEGKQEAHNIAFNKVEQILKEAKK